MGADKLEIHLEELGEHSWGTALLNTLSGSYGSAQFRFVARPPGQHEHASDHQFVGATFPVMRLQDLDNQAEPNAWLDTARNRLRELDEQLVAAGWQREPGKGRHWWSLTYTDAVRPTDPSGRPACCGLPGVQPHLFQQHRRRQRRDGTV